MKKYFLILAVSVLCVLTAFPVTAASDDGAAIVLDGNTVSAAAYRNDGAVYLPLRSVLENLGYRFDWSGEDRTLHILDDRHSVVLDLKNNKIDADGHWSDLAGNFSGPAYIVLSDSIYLEAGLLADNFGLKLDYDEENAIVILNSEGLNPISVKTVGISFSSDYLEVNIQYPEIFGLQDPGVMDRINAVFRDTALNAQREGLINAYDMAKSREQGYNGSPNNCETYFDYEIKYNQNSILSVVFYDYQYAGGAHGVTIQSTYTFDLESGNELNLGDLFKEDVDYTAYIDGAVREEIDQRVAEGGLYEFADNPFVTIGQVPDYYLEDHTVVVYFQQYEYFPGAAGIQEFPVTFSQEDAMLREEYGFLYQQSLIWEMSSDGENVLFPGNIGRVILSGNPTTGYDWHYQIRDEDIVSLDSENYLPDSGMIGAGGTYTWDFIALKEGETKITFKYYRDWEGEDTATEVAEYRVTVK